MRFELLEVATGRTFIKIIESPYLAEKFIQRVKRGKKLKILFKEKL